jgi:hypothetical protein
MNKLSKLTLLSFCLLALAGCAAIVIPVSNGEVTSGRRLTQENIAFLKQGVTTRTEVIQTLGQPDMDFEDLRTIVYQWEIHSADFPWIIVSTGETTGGALKVSDRHALLIAFDGKENLLRSEITKVPPNTPLRTHTVKWAEQQKIDTLKPSERFVTLKHTEKQAVLYIFRPGGWSDAPLLHQPAVSIDGMLVAELRKGGYIACALKPGSHEVSVNPVPHQTTSLRPEERPIRTISFDAQPDAAYYIKVRIKWGLGALDPELTTYSADEAVPILQKLRPTW